MVQCNMSCSCSDIRIQNVYLLFADNMGSVKDEHIKNEYRNKTSHLSFLVSSAYESYLNTIWQSVKCTIALCLKK